MFHKIVIFLLLFQLYEAKIEIYNLDDSLFNEKLPYFTPSKTTNHVATRLSTLHQTQFSNQNYSIFSQFVIQLHTTPSSIDLRKQNGKNHMAEKSKDDFKRVCVFANWAAIRDSPISRIAPEDIDPFLCTHIHYAYANIDYQYFRIVPSLRQDTSISEIGEALYLRIMRLKVKNPKLKILLSIGGWNARSTPFNRILANDFTRSQFIVNAINFMRQWKFDGLDVQWEYPGDIESGATFDSKQKFSAFLKVVYLLIRKY
jgi:GH18 family chitinase